MFLVFPKISMNSNYHPLYPKKKILRCIFKIKSKSIFKQVENWYFLLKILQEWKKSRVIEKFVYVVAVITIIFLTHATVYAQWLLPYYYAVSTPILILIRVIMYW